ncbi:PAS domain-containing hybrid sensor histidine kinase/response regulator [Phenylobacterium sp.]|uniref:hybrid sensor histidine kinase/response regulator n=1 Tax=Phenylobacterium sp. TaxID=1871053 RepID=UPI002737B96E|nr:PAS domain-containing hybrid sensor histidine kinase/response regulator [Phenylobacterium sp.]MDP3869464.1 response regulator [Phenylobacterium sp.]
MSDPLAIVATDPDLLARLQRALVREKSARAQAERLLESKARELYEAVQNLLIESTQARRLSFAVEGADDGLAITDEHGRFTYMNKAHRDLFGYPDAADIVGRPWSMLYSEEQLTRFEREIMPILSRSGKWSGNIVGQAFDGSLVFQDLTLTQLPNGGILCATRDISARLATEERVRALESRMHAAERREELERISRSITHDFGNLTAAIQGYATLLSRELEVGERSRSHLQKILQATDQATAILSSFGRNSQSTQSQVRALDLSAVVSSALDFAEALHPPLLSVARVFPSDPVMVQADEVALSRALLNIITNAFEAIGARGVLTVTVGLRESPVLAAEIAGEVRLGDPVEEPIGFVSFVDTGPGIPSDVLPRIFEPAFSTKSGDAERGYGLESLSWLAKQKGVEVRLRSTPGRGTSVTVTFGDVQAFSKTPATALIRARASARRILVVDDNHAVGELICTFLKDVGHEPRWFADPRDALALIQQAPESLDVLITDYQMPWLTGEELARLAKAAAPHVPIILYSGEADFLKPDSIYSAILHKPIKPETLQYAVANVFSSGDDDDL